MLIRLATSKDARSLAQVHVKSWQHTYRGIVDQQYLDDLNIDARTDRWAKALSDLQNPNETFVGTIDDEVVGFVSIGPSRKEVYPNWGELLAIYLDTEQQKNGYGRLLFDAGRNRLTVLGFNKFFLWVLKDNPTRGFYEQMGGKLGRTDQIEIGAQKLDEVSYEWGL